MKDEIISGLRNALERGQTLESAARSFISAGYNPQEVRAAVNELSGGVSDIVYAKEETTQNVEPKPQPAFRPETPKQATAPTNSQVPITSPNLTAPAPQAPQNPSPKPVNAPASSLPPLPRLPGVPATSMSTGVKSKSILIWIIIATIVFLAGVGYLVYYLLTQ